MKLIQAATPSEGRVTVSNNFPKWRQHDFKIGTISTEIVIYTFLLQSAIFPYNSLYTQAVAYTTYFELGEPVTEKTKKGRKTDPRTTTEQRMANVQMSRTIEHMVRETGTIFRTFLLVRLISVLRILCAKREQFFVLFS